ncbi:MAG: hypothetical protein J5861_02235, partial [Desulfovibrio sp.]|nr:hypothetical protein [Desulfovibrio sp.]
MTEKPACSPSSPADPSTPQPRLQGSIDILRGDIVHGWLSADACPVLPILFMDNRPARCVGLHIPRPDVAEAVGCEPDVGFAFKVSDLRASSILSLYAALPLCLSPVCSLPANRPVWENRFFAQLARASGIARQPEAVAITCWDGAHNPAGRAKVLYDIVTLR